MLNCLLIKCIVLVNQTFDSVSDNTTMSVQAVSTLAVLPLIFYNRSVDILFVRGDVKKKAYYLVVRTTNSKTPP